MTHMFVVPSYVQSADDLGGRAVVKFTFVESKTSPSPKRFESESSTESKEVRVQVQVQMRRSKQRKKKIFFKTTYLIIDN